MDDQQQQDNFDVPVNVVSPERVESTYKEPDHQIPEHTTPDPEPSGTFESRAGGLVMDSVAPQVQESITAPSELSPVPEKEPYVSSIYPTVEPKPHLEPRAEINPAPSLYMPSDDRPVPVVKVLSVRGVEYAMMSILLWLGAGSLIFILVSIISGMSGFDSLAFPISMLLVCLPGFAFLYLRLRKAELSDPSLRLEASKRRYSQITQILAFLTCFFNIVTVVYILISMAGGEEVGSIGKVLGSAAAVLAVAGGILVYYWFDEHKLVGRK
jgi:hypothetical protein